MDTDFQTKMKVLLKLFKAGKYSEADILNMKTEEMLDLPNVSIKEIKVICAIKEAVKKHTLYSYLGGKQMKELSKSIRFIDKHFNTLFYIPDGSQIEVVEPDGKSEILGCQYIDEYHTKIGNEIYHIHDFAELIENGNKTIFPLKKQLER